MNRFNCTQTLYELSKYEIPKSKGGTGLQNKYRFPNDYGASLIYAPGSYGLELAVLDFSVNPEGDLEYGTPITDDVLGNLDWNRATDALLEIKNLKRTSNNDKGQNECSNTTSIILKRSGWYDGTLGLLPGLKRDLLQDVLSAAVSLPTCILENQEFGIKYSSEFKHANKKVKFDHTVITVTYTEKIDRDTYEKYVKDDVEKFNSQEQEDK